MTLHLPLEAVHCRIRRLKPVRICDAWWPTLSMESWASHILENYPKILLAGHVLEDRLGWQRDFKYFWDTYKSIDPHHPVFASDMDYRYLIPYCFHGDEGRGKGKSPFLVFSFQPIISHLGLNYCNDSTCPSCTLTFDVPLGMNFYSPSHGTPVQQILSCHFIGEMVLLVKQFPLTHLETHE